MTEVTAQQGEVVAWQRDLRVHYRGYQIHAMYCGRPSIAPGGAQQLWQCADGKGQRYGGWHPEYLEAAAEIDSAVQQNHECDTSNWYVGSDFQNDAVCTTFVRPDGEKHYGDVLEGESEYVYVWENTHGPGSARDAAYAYYNAMCRTQDVYGSVWIGYLLPGAEGEEPTKMDQEDVELDPAEQEEYRQERYERYLEENAEALAWQDRYEMYQNER